VTHFLDVDSSKLNESVDLLEFRSRKSALLIAFIGRGDWERRGTIVNSVA
jgi:hypothetical protein